MNVIQSRHHLIAALLLWIPIFNSALCRLRLRQIALKVVGIAGYGMISGFAHTRCGAMWGWASTLAPSY